MVHRYEKGSRNILYDLTEDDETFDKRIDERVKEINEKSRRKK